MTANKPGSNNSIINVKATINGTLIAATVSVFCALILAIVYHVSGFMDPSLPLGSSIIIFIGVLAGSYFTSKKAGTKGLFHGLAVGTTVFILIVGLIIFLPVDIAPMTIINKIFVCLIAGAVGGIFGVSYR